MSMVKTGAGEIGLVVAGAVRESMAKASAGLTVATYIEGQAPLSWDLIADAGWDMAGVVEDEDSATLRDLVEIAGAWGESFIQLPLLTTILAKRHSAAAAEVDGPVTFSIPAQSLPVATGFVPFGQLSGISIVKSFAPPGAVETLGGILPLAFAPSLLGASSTTLTVLTDAVRREFAVVWAAEAAGIVKRVLADAVEFTKQRQQFGRPIGSFQAVKHHLANAHMAAQQAETAVIWASLDHERAEQAVRQSFRESFRSIQLSIQVYGGLGFTWEMGVHFFLRHIVSLRELATGVIAHA